MTPVQFRVVANEQAGPAELGPLAPLIGHWRGNEGLDDAFVWARRRVEQVGFREEAIFVPAGPAHNGAQELYRLDYRTTAWRLDEDEPFHTEIGYWFWDPEHELVMRGLVTPRGIVTLAGGTACPVDTTITVRAEQSSGSFGILSNPYLTKTAQTTEFRVTVDLSVPDRFSYDQQTYMLQPWTDDRYCHRDRNTLTRTR
jgi:hypothetical protein